MRTGPDRKRSLLPGLAAMALASLLAAGLSQAEARVAPSGAEQRLVDADPELYGMAKAYFPGDTEALPPRRIFRLTRDQIDRSVAALLPRHTKGSVKAAMPRDPLQTNYEYAELIGLNAANWGPLSGWIGEIAARVGKDPTPVADCPGGASDTVCLERAARQFVTRAFRGAASLDRIDKLARFFLAGAKAGGIGQAAADLVEVVLSSPDFLFRKELEIGPTGELVPAQRLETLAYTLADAPPEALGLDPAKAASYFAGSPDTLVERIAASPAARAKLQRFFKAWLEIKEPADFTISRQAFPEFTQELAAAMVAETDRFLEAGLSGPRPRLKDLTQAAGLAVAKPAEPPPPPRLGIFSQPAVLASHSGPDGTRLVKRGVFWVRKVMCMEMEPPPPGVDTTQYAAASTTERARIEQITAAKACIGCHKKIDPFGFALENYDALGRWRTLDNGFPIDAAVAFDLPDEEPAKTTGPVEALRLLAGSMLLKQCFVRQIFRFYMGRSEEPGDDPLLRRMLFAFAQKDEQDILKLLRVMAADARMVRRQ